MRRSALRAVYGVSSRPTEQGDPPVAVGRGPAAFATNQPASLSSEGGGGPELAWQGPSAQGRVQGLGHGGLDALGPVQRRALEQLQAWAPALQQKEGWAWVDVALVYDVHAWQAYLKAPVRRIAVATEVKETLSAVRLQQGRSERLLDQMYRLVRDGKTQGLREAQEGRIQALELQCLRYAVLVEELQAQQESCPPDIAGWVGALMAFDRSGWVLVKRHLVRREDWLSMERALWRPRGKAAGGGLPAGMS